MELGKVAVTSEVIAAAHANVTVFTPLFVASISLILEDTVGVGGVYLVSQSVNTGVIACFSASNSSKAASTLAADKLVEPA